MKERPNLGSGYRTSGTPVDNKTLSVKASALQPPKTENENGRGILFPLIPTPGNHTASPPPRRPLVRVERHLMEDKKRLTRNVKDCINLFLEREGGQWIWGKG